MPDSELRPSERGHTEQSTWGAVELGHIVQDKNGRFWNVTKDELGWVQLTAGDDVRALPKPPPATAVTVYVPSEDESLKLLIEGLGARILRDIGERVRTETRALLWRMDPIPRSAKSLRDHIDWAHGVYVNDVSGRYERAAADKTMNAKKKKENAAKKRASLAELVEAHDEFHRDSHLWPQQLPHHHAKIGD